MQRSSRLRTCLAIAFAAFAVTACAAETEDETPPAQTEDELQSSPLARSMMKDHATPKGMPKPWDQPDSTGWFGEGGKCGPTATANLLKLYSINVSPQDADEDGVHWLIGTRGVQIRDYLKQHHAQLGCTLEHPTDGPTFLRNQIAGGHPVLVWYNTEGGFSSHWVAAVAIEGTGNNEQVVVMSWGKYFSIPMKTLDAAWRNVYGIRRPSVVCTRTSPVLKPR